MPPLLDVRNLTTHIRTSRGVVRAVEDVSFTLEAGETLGVVGESGCGKSMTGLSLMGLLPPGGTVLKGSSIRLDGRELVGLPPRALRRVRGEDIAMVFQDPMTSLDPTKTIGHQVAEPVLLHRGGTRAQARERAVEMLGLVGLPQPGRRLADYPHQLSGGQRQRALIAMALVNEPRVLIADEPTTALDVTIQAQILALLADLRARLGMAMILITHDMGVTAGNTDRVQVMYAGRIAESAGTDRLFDGMRHPYTQRLLASVPRLAQDPARRLPTIPGLPPDLVDPPVGCRFAPRCPYATDRCRTEDPTLAGTGDHRFACWHPVDGPAAIDGPEPADAPEPVAQDMADGAGAQDTPDTPDLAKGGAADAGPARAATRVRVREPEHRKADEGEDAAVRAAHPGTGEDIADASGRYAQGRGADGPAAGEPALLEARGLVREFPVRGARLPGRPRRVVHAVSDVSFSLAPGETFGLVGESGCGKTTLGRLLVGLDRPDAGTVALEGTGLDSLRGRDLRRRRRDLHMVFQDPYSSLDPRMRVGSILREPLRIHGVGSAGEQKARVAELMAEVGLPERGLDLFPHEFSGGQRQRIGLARALALTPKVIVADEPVSALDVSVRAQVLNLMRRLQSSHGLSYVVISHDLAVVRHLADRIGVMYLGRLVEVGRAEDVHLRAVHPYTAGLLAAVPVPDPAAERAKRGRGIGGELPDPTDPPSGCRFRTRCPLARERCASEEPVLRSFGPGHTAACHYPLDGPAALPRP